MTVDGFRKLALSFPEAEERAHMGHPDFRVCGKIFATLGYPDTGWAMVRLTPEQQDGFVDADSKAFMPVKGGWGVKGATNVHLKSAKPALVKAALTAAWLNMAPKKLAARLER